MIHHFVQVIFLCIKFNIVTRYNEFTQFVLNQSVHHLNLHLYILPYLELIARTKSRSRHIRICKKFKYLTSNLNKVHMSQLLKNVILSGVFSIQSPDTSGEVFDVAGAYIDQLPGAVLNTEHIKPPDAEKSST